MTGSRSEGLMWRRSRSCGSNACVEVAWAGDTYYLRDSKTPDGPTLRFTTEEWNAFAHGMAAGDFVFDR